MGEVIVGHGVHFVMCIAYLVCSCVVKTKVWFGVVQFGMAWVSRGYCGAGRERRTEVYGGSRGRLGLPSPGMSVMSQDRDSAQVVYL